MTTILEPDTPLSPEDIAQVERTISLRLPESVRQHYLRWNGGRPEDDMFDGTPYPIICDVLPLITTKNIPTAVDHYTISILEQEIAPRTFFPFGIEAGGDLFFVDCGTAEGFVHYFIHDTYFEDERLVALGVGFAEFWRRLKKAD